MKLIRVKYGKKDTPKELREYQMDGFGPVGCLEEFKKQFVCEEFDLYERCCEQIVRIGSKCPVCKTEAK